MRRKLGKKLAGTLRDIGHGVRCGEIIIDRSARRPALPPSLSQPILYARPGLVDGRACKRQTPNAVMSRRMQTGSLTSQLALV